MRIFRKPKNIIFFDFEADKQTSFQNLCDALYIDSSFHNLHYFFHFLLSKIGLASDTNLTLSCCIGIFSILVVFQLNFTTNFLKPCTSFAMSLLMDCFIDTIVSFTFPSLPFRLLISMVDSSSCSFASLSSSRTYMFSRSKLFIFSSKLGVCCS